MRRRLHDQAAHLLLADLDAVRGADLRQQQAEAHAALGDLAIFGRILLDLGERGLRIGLVARLVAKLVEDVLILGLDHRFRHREIVARGELVEQLALHVGAGQAVELLLLLVADQAACSCSRLWRPSDLANSSSTLVSPAVFTALTVTSKVAALPFEIRRPDNRPGRSP